MPCKVFISAALKNVHSARIAVNKLWMEGFEITSRWHDETEADTQEPTDREARQKILGDNLRDLDEADAVLVLTDGGPRCALVEAGYALARGKFVVFVGEVRNIADSHPNARAAESIEGGVSVLCNIEFGGSHSVQPGGVSVPNVLLPPSVGMKFDNGKLDWTLVPFDGLDPVVRVLDFGAKKYSRDNWRHVTPAWRYFQAAFRHMVEYVLGRRVDPESGESPLAHAVCSLLFFLALTKGDAETLHPPVQGPGSAA